MSRVREEARGATLREATRHALAHTGPVITSVGIILAGTFSALMTLPLQDLLQLGFGVAAGVLTDTFVTRTLIVPAVVSLVGRWNWWPSRMAPRPLEAGAGDSNPVAVGQSRVYLGVPTPIGLTTVPGTPIRCRRVTGVALLGRQAADEVTTL